MFCSAFSWFSLAIKFMQSLKTVKAKLLPVQRPKFISNIPRLVWHLTLVGLIHVHGLVPHFHRNHIHST